MDMAKIEIPVDKVNDLLEIVEKNLWWRKKEIVSQATAVNNAKKDYHDMAVRPDRQYHYGVIYEDQLNLLDKYKRDYVETLKIYYYLRGEPREITEDDIGSAIDPGYIL